MADKPLTYGEKIAAEYDLTVYCHPCDRKVEFDPSNVIESERPIGRRFRCTLCDERGQCIVLPKWRNADVPGGKIPYRTGAFERPQIPDE